MTHLFGARLFYARSSALIIWSLLVLALISSTGHATESPNASSQQSINQISEQTIADLSLQLFATQGPAKAPIADALAALNDKSLIPTLVLAMRWTGSNIHVARALSKLAGEEIETWHEAYEWQERHPEIIPHSTYKALKLRFLGNTDKRFKTLFADPYGKRENMLIRLEEVLWGGVRFDDIPSLDQATMIKAADADYLLDSDLVFGIEINGDARAYPLRIMGWHEMFNDVIGGVPVALAYCTLCGSGILFETSLEEFDKPLVFGSSGLLYRSNKLMFDRSTNSLWNQFSGEPVVGSLVGKNIKLKVLPVTITTWEAWQQQHQGTSVLSLDTGHSRNYSSGFVYREYFASPDLMFPAAVEDESQALRKDYVFGVRSVAASKAWPLKVFADEPVINDVVGVQSLVLVGDAATRTVRAYERNPDEEFVLTLDGKLSTAGQGWQLDESFLVSADGKQKRARLPGHISYWFAWENFMGVKSELYKP